MGWGDQDTYIRKQKEADEWQDLHSKFMQLAKEEEATPEAIRGDRLLRAYCNYKEHPEGWEIGKPEQGLIGLLKTPECGLWTISDGVSENFQARFRTLAARAGIALCCPKDTDAEDFWLHRLYADLLETNSDQLFAASKEGGMILRVCVASATFCSRLEAKALKQHKSSDLRTDANQAKSSRAQDSANHAQDVKSNSTNAAAGSSEEAFIDRAIASRKRMESSISGDGRDADPSVLDAQKSRYLLGIDLADLENLRRAVWIKFFDEASLPRVVETEWETVLSSRKMPDSDVDLGLTFALIREYAKAISRASAELSDLLVTATLSRVSQAHFREAIWRECLDFAYQLGQWDAFVTWVQRVVHIGWRVVDADGAPSLSPDRECEERLEERRKFFARRIGMYSHEWLSAIDRAIELRRTVSATSSVNATGEMGNRAPSGIIPTPSKKRDPEVAKRRALVKSNAGVSVRELCEIFDREKVPVPAIWQAAGHKTWIEAHRKYPTRIKVIVSKDRRSD
jgi:hypothetical protein